MVLARSTRRLPGFRFEVQAPALDEVLSRMDVAIFVGFAASGPIEIPVEVESSAQFQAIFGDDAPLAWDTQRGVQIYAYLAPAVRAFFRNGGVRCLIVRVARTSIDPRNLDDNVTHNCARKNHFPIPGLARAQFDKDGNVSAFAPAFARARSEGSWSDSLRVSTALQVSPMQVSQVVQWGGAEPVFDLALSSPGDLSVGDLLRLSFKPEGHMLLLAVKKIETAPESSPPFRAATRGRRTVRVTGTKALWCRRFSLDEFSPPDSSVDAALYTFELESLTVRNIASDQRAVASEQNAPPTFESVAAARVVAREVASPPSLSTDADQIEQTLTVDLLDVTFADAPKPGALICLKFPGQPVWMTVQDLSMQRDQTTAREFARVTGQALATLSQAPTTLPLTTPTIEKLSFELWVRESDEYAIRLSDLGFESGHERFWGSLPTDEELYGEIEPGTQTKPAIAWWRPTEDVSRFPLAGGLGEDELFFPLVMSPLANQYLRPVRLPGTTLERDGLARFDASLFLDQALLESNVEDFLSDSEFVRFLSARPRALHGIHAAVGKDEATIIAVPDAVHCGWQLTAAEVAPPPESPPSLLRSDWWHFLDCQPKAEIKAAPIPEWGNFLSCAIRLISAPVLIDVDDPVNESGTFTLSWIFNASVLKANETATFYLEESAGADFTGARCIYQGASSSFTVYGRRFGDYYYHVRAIAGSDTSDWSNGRAVRVTSVNRWRLKSEGDYRSGTLLAIQRSLLRMCAARGDLFALLSLPEHYREEQTLNHVTTLKLTPERTPPTEDVAALGYGEARAFSYGAIFHPWLVGREENQFNELRRTPPCGALGGILAHRAITRGAWIAPANDAVSDVVTLFPLIHSQQRLSLQEAQINLIRQEPRGFLSLSADTLSDDADFRPINVRRLLMLLRRMALRLGATYVFEPQSDAFRRLVARGFNGMLDQLFVRGAFAGRTPATSYQVVTDETLNTPQSTDLGRFIVELRVAPSLPMRFLTVRLVQTGDLGLVTEGRS